MPTGKKITDLVGQRFSRLVVIEPIEENEHGTIIWKCLCDCGNYKNVSTKNLRNGRVRSCGCLAKEIFSKSRMASIKIPGLTIATTRIYRIWYETKRRCYNLKCIQYNNYGGRGITVCDEWRNNSATFYNWAISNGYADNLTIDRKDNNGNYCPDNCRWLTQKEQQNNRRNNRLIEFNGETKTISEWGEKYNINYNLIAYRLKIGWTIEKALITPVHKKSV